MSSNLTDEPDFFERVSGNPSTKKTSDVEELSIGNMIQTEIDLAIIRDILGLADNMMKPEQVEAVFKDDSDKGSSGT